MPEVERVIFETIRPLRRGHDPEESLDAYCERAAKAVGRALREKGLTSDGMAEETAES